jgi:hypothetical protein
MKGLFVATTILSIAISLGACRRQIGHDVPMKVGEVNTVGETVIPT